MSTRNIMFEKKKIPRKKNHRWRKFQKSKRGMYVKTDSRGKVLYESDVPKAAKVVKKRK